jgi:acetolactate synthase small subunit
MTNVEEARTTALGQCLGRLETLIETLEGVKDADARRVARELMEATLDLHGLALAKVLTICQSAEDGDGLIRRLIADEYVSAVALLHGLHPQNAEARLQSKIAAMRPHWGVRGFRVDVVDVDRTTARVHVSFSDDVIRANIDVVTREVEQTLTEVAPDLDRIIVEGLEECTAPSQLAGTWATSNTLDVGAP